MRDHILEKLYDVLQERKNAEGETSYVASLYEGGSIKIAEKILEEAQEFIDEALLLDNAPNDGITQRNIRAEAADLLFHMLVMLAHHDVDPKDIFEVLEQRLGTSGHTEKASR
ncbi:MAG: phosphoribosyl-ATP diphosphatase [Alphaproteobacteria bacterium]|nr:phosphoribosyl-ATP diphosphatase [Alphaproteobacteria bacterium]